jgi:predicted dehydrogenase
MGRWHAQKFAALPESRLVAVVDVQPDRAQAVADECGAPSALRDHHDLIGKVDAVALATPTSTHFDIARTLLQNGIHVLVEKPIAASIEEARVLVEIAEAKDFVLQVGHLERFNPAIIAITDRVVDPLFVESTRIAPYKPRSLDVSVVLDLMIHDIDLVHRRGRPADFLRQH